MAQKREELENLPLVASEYIEAIIKKMRYRRKVRQEVKAELAGHFADALKDCRTDEERQVKARQLIDEFGDAKLLATLIRRGKNRCRPLWRTIVARSFGAVWILFVLLVCYCVYISFAQPRIGINYVDETNRLARPVADESLNAAVLYQKAIELYVKPPKIEREVKQRTKEMDLLDAIRDKRWITELTEEEVALLEQWADDNTEAIDYFKEGSERPYCWWEWEAKDDVLLFVDIPIGPIRDLAKLICWQAKLKANQGQVEEAFDDLLSCYRTGQHLKGPHIIIEQLVGIDMQRLAVANVLVVLGRCEMEEDMLRDFHERLAERAGNDVFTVDFQTERFLYRDIIQRCFTDNGNGSGRMIPDKIGEFEPILNTGLALGREGIKEMCVSLVVALVSADRKAMVWKFEDAFSKYETWSKMTPWELKQTDIDEWECKEFSEAPALERSRYLLYHAMLPGLRRVSEMAHRNRAEVEGLMTVISILRYNKETKRCPEKLSELVEAGLLRKLPMDPHSDNPLVYRTMNDGFTLYSVGADFEDDGGAIGKDEEGHMKMWADEGDAVFWPVRW